MVYVPIHIIYTAGERGGVGYSRGIHSNAFKNDKYHFDDQPSVNIQSESASEVFLLPSKFTPTRNLFWHIGADNKHKKHNKYYRT